MKNSNAVLTLAGATLVLATGCAHAVGGMPAAGAPPIGTTQVASTVSTEVRAPLATVFDYVVRRETPARDLRAYGPIGGVRGDIKLTAGGWDHPGARRIVQLDDGTTLREQIDLIDPRGRFQYRVADFSSSFGAFVEEGHGYWSFSPTSTGTRVTWTYVLTARSCEARPVVAAAVDAFFHPYMERGMSSIRAHIEGG